MPIHDLDGDSFADMWAQTITYGLFSASVSRPAGIHSGNLVDSRSHCPERYEFDAVAIRKSLEFFFELVDVERRRACVGFYCMDFHPYRFGVTGEVSCVGQKQSRQASTPTSPCENTPADMGAPPISRMKSHMG
jgi:hypothetical protein